MTGLTATAQVEWKDRYVTLASGDQKNPSIAQPPGTNYTVIVWEDYRNGTSDIYAQMIENENGVAVWFPIDGVPVCTADGEQRNPRAAFDGEGNVIICWEDYRYDLTTPFNQDQNRPEVWATMILGYDGTEDLTWSGGRRIAGGSEYRAYRPRIVGTLDGAFITWTDTRYPYQGGLAGSRRDIYLQYMLSSTASWPAGWASGGLQANATIGRPEQNSEVVLDSVYDVQSGRCGVVVAYECPIIDQYNICMNRFNASGQRLWGNQDVQIAPFNARQNHPKIASVRLNSVGLPSNCVAVTWEDYRYANLSPGWFADIFAQLVDVDTGLPQWPNTLSHEGISIAANLNQQINPDIVVSDGIAAVCWEEVGSDAQISLWANTVNLSTQNLYSATGVQVAAENANPYYFCMGVVPNPMTSGALWVGWQDERGSSGMDIYYQSYFMSTLQPLLEANGRPVTKAKGDQTTPAMGMGLLVFADERRMSIPDDDTEDWNIYAQKPGYECDGPTHMHWRDEFA